MKVENRMTELKSNFQTYKEIILYGLIAIPIGIFTGMIDTVFGRGLLWITDFRGEHVKFLVPFLGVAGLFIVFVYQKYGKNSGKGMSLIFEVAHGEEKDIPLRLVPLVMGTTWLTHLFGGSAGREGVAVQIGATLSHKIGKRLPFKNAAHTFLIVGMAAGFSGLFRTPLAATLFAMEVICVGRMEYRAFFPAFVAAVCSCETSRLLGLEKFSFALSENTTIDRDLFLKLLLVGVIFGITGGLFTGLLHGMKAYFAKKLPNPYLRIVIIGCILSVLLIVLHKGRYCGLGTNLISESIDGSVIEVYDWLLKLLFTVVTLAAGFQGGEVTPLFSIGASLGAVLAYLFGLPVSLIAALGYASVFGSATNTLLAPIFIGGEVFGFAYLPHFFVVCGIAYIFNGNQSIYALQKKETSL